MARKCIKCTCEHFIWTPGFREKRKGDGKWKSIKGKGKKVRVQENIKNDLYGGIFSTPISGHMLQHGAASPDLRPFTRGSDVSVRWTVWTEALKMQDMKFQDMARIDSIVFNFSFFFLVLWCWRCSNGTVLCDNEMNWKKYTWQVCEWSYLSKWHQRY